MQLSTFDAEINEIKQDLQRNIHPQLEADALSLTICDLTSTP